MKPRLFLYYDARVNQVFLLWPKISKAKRNWNYIFNDWKGDKVRSWLRNEDICRQMIQDGILVSLGTVPGDFYDYNKSDIQ
jgi:hypothetical protein